MILTGSLYLRKVLVALAQDVRVLILKLAGRIHNLRTNGCGLILIYSKRQKRKLLVAEFQLRRQVWN